DAMAAISVTVHLVLVFHQRVIRDIGIAEVVADLSWCLFGRLNAAGDHLAWSGQPALGLADLPKLDHDCHDDQRGKHADAHDHENGAFGHDSLPSSARP